MSYNVITGKRFDKSLKRCVKRGLDLSKLTAVITLLAKNGKLPPIYRPHRLSSVYAGCWECHIQPDWLLIWEQNDIELTLLFVDTGSHSDLF